MSHIKGMLLALLLAASAVGGQTPAAKPGMLVLAGATLIDGTGQAPLADSVVVIRGDRIESVGSRSQVKFPEGARVVELPGKWIIPGLIDAHVHFFQSGGLYTRPDVIDLRDRVPYQQELEWIRQRLPGTFRRYLCSGVTAVVDVGGPMWNFQVRELASASQPAPRVAVAGPLVSTYAPPQIQTDDPAVIKVDTPAEARKLVRGELGQKPDLVKIWFIRPPGVPLEEQLPLVRAAIEESHAGGVRVAVHATELETAKAAVRAGADVLVHSVADQPVDEEFIQLVKERGVFYTSSLIVFEGYEEVLEQKVELTAFERTCGDPEVIATWADLASVPEETRPRRPRRLALSMRVMQANLKRMQEAGALVAAGTDAGNIGTLHGPAIHREFELMAAAGLTPMEIIVAATRNAARVFSPEPDMGTLEPGKLADLVILEADPLDDIRNARRISQVIKGGQVFDRDTLLEPAH